MMYRLEKSMKLCYLQKRRVRINRIVGCNFIITCLLRIAFGIAMLASFLFKRMLEEE